MSRDQRSNNALEQLQMTFATPRHLLTPFEESLQAAEMHTRTLPQHRPKSDTGGPSSFTNTALVRKGLLALQNPPVTHDGIRRQRLTPSDMRNGYFYNGRRRPQASLRTVLQGDPEIQLLASSDYDARVARYNSRPATPSKDVARASSNRKPLIKTVKSKIVTLKLSSRLLARFNEDKAFPKSKTASKIGVKDTQPTENERETRMARRVDLKAFAQSAKVVTNPVLSRHQPAEHSKLKLVQSVDDDTIIMTLPDGHAQSTGLPCIRATQC